MTAAACRIIPDCEENSAHNVSHEKQLSFFFSFFDKKWRLSVDFSSEFDSRILNRILVGILITS